ncbi:RING-H2 finger protein ATL46 [Brachypodium distachyon]|uniref:RING-type E3 ubiquitin transferase n=1 Tax=Brachypodium distachyon TaxID=15368 RepID=I1H0N6_BRADI|nr:RING-H2 finger protein ATL46 [Brachypodium distachyon]KQK19432.1 hypothetical protein BRADI_1g48250v3 [Brachypodium distachyon]|eukprot:XP_010227990.1 RING-H2 finger protein ATL46 [Brachypodium distachyon]
MRISPVLLFVVVILAGVVFVSGLLHLLVRLLRWHARRIRSAAVEGAADEAGTAEVGEDSAALQRQLQQLFHLHDAGLDQAVIDALPVFAYGDAVAGGGAGAKEPFDCAVCLCEFAGDDRLRLLPPCGHAFHVDCIDTWLLSNSTCPLCRCALLDADLFDGAEAAAGDDWRRREDQEEEEEGAVFPVRLGKFKSASRAGPVVIRDGDDPAVAAREEEDTSSGRRCYSMGSYQYVLAEASLQVSVHRRRGGDGAERMRGPRGISGGGGNPAGGGGEGKKIGAGSRGDSFSVSKIWQWPRNGKGKLPVLASDDSSPALQQWPRRSVGES